MPTPLEAVDPVEVVEALVASLKLGYGRKARSLFYLAMAESKRGRKEQAQMYYEQGTAWMRKNPSSRAAFPQSQFRAEAAEVLGIEDQ